MKLIERTTVVVALAGAVAAAVIAVSSPDRSVKPVQRTPGAIDTEFERCSKMGLAALDDAVCATIWGSDRDRFYEMQRHEAPNNNPPSPAAPPGTTH
jgi:conjugative transfer region protein TrbK